MVLKTLFVWTQIQVAQVPSPSEAPKIGEMAVDVHLNCVEDLGLVSQTQNFSDLPFSYGVLCLTTSVILIPLLI